MLRYTSSILTEGLGKAEKNKTVSTRKMFWTRDNQKGRVAVTVLCCSVPPSGQIYIDDEEQVPPKCRHTSTRIHVSHPRKIFTATTVKTSDLTTKLKPHIM